MTTINRLAIDLYSGDADPDFRAVYASGIRLVIHKASEGSTWRDHKYAQRRNAAKAAGLMFGAYHFARGGDLNSEVANFLSAANPDADTRLVLDWETIGANVSFARAFLQAIDNEIGRPTILYSYTSFLKDQLGASRDTFLGLHPLWVAQYNDIRPTPQASWDRFLLWQYTDGQSGPAPHAVPGIDGACDCNHFDGTEADLRAAWLADATKPVTPAPQPWDSVVWQMFAPPRSPRMAWAQSILLALYPNVDATFPMDGLDGPRTQNLVRRFQRDRNLEVDGVIGPKTETALKAAV